MKRFFSIPVLLAWMLVAAPPVAADPMDDLLQQYQAAFEAAKPPPQSSVRADYKFDQIAMGGLFTARSLKLLYQQTQESLRRQDEILLKYDRIIQQNDEIIRLLEKIADKTH